MSDPRGVPGHDRWCRVVTLDLRTGSEPAPPARRIFSQAVFDTQQCAQRRNLLLTLIIPVVVLFWPC